MNNYKIYCLTNEINGKKYIGITRQDLEKRWKNGKGYKKTTRINMAIKKYGWDNFKKEILFENYDNQLASDMEALYINKYKTIENGYNVQSGGFKDYTTKMSEYHKNCISKANKGKHLSVSTEFKKGTYYQSSRNKKVPVLCVELDKKFDSIKQAQNELKLNHIWDCINGKRNMCGGYHWQLIKESE